MIRRESILRIFLLLVFFLCGCSHFRMLPYLFDSDPSEEEVKRQNAVVRGRGLFHEFCGSCHTLFHGPPRRAHYKGTVPPPSLALIAKEKSINIFVARTAIGKGAGMIGFEDTLSEREMWDIAHFVYEQKDLQ